MSTNQSNSPWTSELKETVIRLAEKGLGPTAIARQVGMSKNQIIGWLDRNYCGYGYAPTTADRLQALHDKMDAVLADNPPRWNK